MYRFLVVDDEPVIRMGLKKIIETSGVPCERVMEAANGVEALALMEAFRPDFMFVDIRMPKMDGIELCRTIAGSHASVQVAVVSGYDDFAYAKACMEYGVSQYILKPINLKTIAEVLRKMVDKKETSVRHTMALATMEQRVEALETAVWTLDREGIVRWFDEWNRDFHGGRLSGREQRELLRECRACLLTRLQERGLHVRMVEPPEDAEGGEFERFRQAVDGLVERIAKTRKGEYVDPILAAKAYIDRNLAREVSLEEVAEFIGLNASYFSQLFKQVTHETFVQYRIRKRMEKAMELLALAHYRITDISFEIGYADHAHFTKTFKKQTGMTPSEYRTKLGVL